jgi:hypothetical protein
MLAPAYPVFLLNPDPGEQVNGFMVAGAEMAAGNIWPDTAIK